MKSFAVARVVAAVALILWAAFWFWVFSFAFSDSFFDYNRHSRIPTFLTALLVAVLVPVSAFVWWRRASSSSLQALIAHALTCVALLALPVAVSAVLSRADRPWHLEADDAMGVGIDFLLLLGIATASIIVMVVAVAVRSRKSPRDPRARRRINGQADSERP